MTGCTTNRPNLSAQIPGKVVIFGGAIDGRVPMLHHHFRRDGKFAYVFWQMHTTDDFHLAPLLSQEMGYMPGIVNLRITEHATFWQAVARELTLWLYEPRTVTVEGDVVSAVP